MLLSDFNSLFESLSDSIYQSFNEIHVVEFSAGVDCCESHQLFELGFGQFLAERRHYLAKIGDSEFSDRVAVENGKSRGEFRPLVGRPRHFATQRRELSECYFSGSCRVDSAFGRSVAVGARLGRLEEGRDLRLARTEATRAQYRAELRRANATLALLVKQTEGLFQFKHFLVTQFIFLDFLCIGFIFS